MESSRGLKLQQLYGTSCDAERYDAERQWPRRCAVPKSRIRPDPSHGVEHRLPSWEQRSAVAIRDEPSAESAWGIGYDD